MTQDPAETASDRTLLDEEIRRTMDEAARVVGQNDEDDASDGSHADAGLSERLEAALKERDALNDRWMRAMADLDNYRKRVRREIEDAVDRATQDLLSSFLPTVDNLERALEVAHGSAGPNAVAQLATGIKMVRDEFLNALQKSGIEPVPAVGHPFDPAMHEALQQIASPDHAPGVVIQEFERGYRRRERLLRPARVIVAGPESSGQAG